MASRLSRRGSVYLMIIVGAILMIGLMVGFQMQMDQQVARARRLKGSAEAALSPVSLGGLLLNRASAGAALEQFDHYLAASPGAALAAEALYGRARALQALGRHAEEKRTWEQLLSRFPGCPYRESARRRLRELG